MANICASWKFLAPLILGSLATVAGGALTTLVLASPRAGSPGLPGTTSIAAADVRARGHARIEVNGFSLGVLTSSLPLHPELNSAVSSPITLQQFSAQSEAQRFESLLLLNARTKYTTALEVRLSLLEQPTEVEIRSEYIRALNRQEILDKIRAIQRTFSVPSTVATSELHALLTQLFDEPLRMTDHGELSLGAFTVFRPGGLGDHPIIALGDAAIPFLAARIVDCDYPIREMVLYRHLLREAMSTFPLLVSTEEIVAFRITVGDLWENSEPFRLARAALDSVRNEIDDRESLPADGIPPAWLVDNIEISESLVILQGTFVLAGPCDQNHMLHPIRSIGIKALPSLVGKNRTDPREIRNCVILAHSLERRLTRIEAQIARGGMPPLADFKAEYDRLTLRYRERD